MIDLQLLVFLSGMLITLLGYWSWLRWWCPNARRARRLRRALDDFRKEFRRLLGVDE